MYERMLCKTQVPTEEHIRQTIGDRQKLLDGFETRLRDHYQLVRELKFPFGGSYGWGYKYSHKTAHLCYVFFEQGAFTVTLQLGDNAVPAIDERLPGMLPKTNALWTNRYPCGKSGGWVHYRVLLPDEINDVVELIKIKKPLKKR